MWARSLGRHAYFGGLFCLDEPTEDVDYAVFDDMQEDSNFSMDTNFGWAVNLNSTQQTNIRESDSYNGEGSQSG